MKKMSWLNSLLGGGLGGLVDAAGVLGLADLEAVLESARDVLLVPHAASAGGLSPLSLLTPVDCESIMLARLCPSRRRPHHHGRISSPLGMLYLELRDYVIRDIGMGVMATYTCGSWQKGSRKRSTPSSGCAESGDLMMLPLAKAGPQKHIPKHCSPMFWSISSLVEGKSGGGKTNRIDGTECASCCDAYRSWRYPSL